MERGMPEQTGIAVLPTGLGQVSNQVLDRGGVYGQGF